MKDGEFTESSYLKWHRYGSLAVVLATTAWLSIHIGVGRSVRVAALSVAPLAMIWFAEQLAGLGRFTSHGWFKPDREDCVVRAIGWAAIVGGVLFLLAVVH